MATELEQTLRIAGPIEASCTFLVLLENSIGRWRELHVFELPAPSNSTA